MNIFKLHCSAQFCVGLAYALLVHFQASNNRFKVLNNAYNTNMFLLEDIIRNWIANIYLTYFLFRYDLEPPIYAFLKYCIK